MLVWHIFWHQRKKLFNKKFYVDSKSTHPAYIILRFLSPTHVWLSAQSLKVLERSKNIYIWKRRVVIVSESGNFSSILPIQFLILLSTPCWFIMIYVFLLKLKLSPKMIYLVNPNLTSRSSQNIIIIPLDDFGTMGIFFFLKFSNWLFLSWLRIH